MASRGADREDVIARSASARPDESHEDVGSRRDPEERPATSDEELRDKMLDKTLADSFPTSDPPSTLPDPASDDSLLSDSEETPNKKNPAA
jgi:hypothetical protein